MLLHGLDCVAAQSARGNGAAPNLSGSCIHAPDTAHALVAAAHILGNKNESALGLRLSRFGLPVRQGDDTPKNQQDKKNTHTASFLEVEQQVYAA